jgi:hypothetical protein
MTMDGSYTPVSMEINARTETGMAGAQVTREMHMTGRRIGECPAGQTGKAG